MAIMFYDREEVVDLVKELVENDESTIHGGMEVYIHPDIANIVLELNEMDWLCIYQAYPNRMHMIFREDKGPLISDSLEDLTRRKEEYLTQKKLAYGETVFLGEKFYGLEFGPWNSLDIMIFDSDFMGDIVELLEGVD